jgi:hypothetical protein
MRQSQDTMEEGANRKRLPAPQIQEGTAVWLDARHIQTTRPFRKWDWIRQVPFIVIRKVSYYAYELKLLKGLRIHPIHLVSLLEPGAEDQLAG